MKVARSSHGICFHNNFIYLIGGFSNNQKMTNSVERFSVSTNQCEYIAPLNHAASSICCTLFNKNYIFKFGGIGENRKLSPYIERYSIQKNTWDIIEPTYEKTPFMLLSTSCCI